MTVEFDPAESSGDNPEFPLGEAAAFYAFLLGYWGEEGEQDINWAGDTVTLSVEVLDYLHEPMKWVTGYAIPKRMDLQRMEPR